jgi:hypothetical protein
MRGHQRRGYYVFMTALQQRTRLLFKAGLRNALLTESSLEGRRVIVDAARIWGVLRIVQVTTPLCV